MGVDPRLEQLFEEGLRPYQDRQSQAAQRQARVVPPMVLTVWQPWAWALIRGTKRVENRGHATDYRGRLLIHVGQGPKSGWDDYVAQALANFPPGPRPSIADLRSELGQVIGEVTMIDVCPPCETPADPWAIPGQFQWVVRSPKCYRQPFALRGQQGLFRLPKEAEPALRLAGAQSWYCDELDVNTTSPLEAVTAFQLAGVKRIDTPILVNRQRLYFGELLATAARWSGEEALAVRFEQGLRDRLHRTRGQVPGACLLGAALASIGPRERKREAHYHACLASEAIQ